MGGHGALVCALRNPSRYKSVSAFAPIAAPMQVSLGKKGVQRTISARTPQAWREYDASELVARKPFPRPILIDQGTADQFLPSSCCPEKFAAAAAKSGQQLTLRMQPGYDHGYYFIQTFMADHLRHHAAISEEIDRVARRMQRETSGAEVMRPSKSIHTCCAKSYSLQRRTVFQ